MQHARPTLHKIFAATLQRSAGDNAPVIVWPLACGPTVAGRTSALRCVDGELSVGVPDAMWCNQLQSLSSRYVAAVNQLSKRKVSSIRFVVSR
jgi:hypothetical protein